VTLRPGKITVVALLEDKKVHLLVLHDDGVARGMARLRAVHAAAEVGRSDVRVDGRMVAELSLGQATGYAKLAPGSYDVSVTRPGGGGGAMISQPHLALTAGSTSTAVVVGSAGMPAHFVLMSDAVAGPRAAPATGFGGGVIGDGGGGWLLVLLAGLAGGALGGTTYTLLSSRARRAG
jgi:hypothetical protein